MQLKKRQLALSMMTALISVPANAQVAPDPGAAIAAERTALSRLDWMNGQWRGTAVTQTASGEHRVTQTERVGNLLGGTIKLVEGRGFTHDGRLGFNAFGVISFNPESGQYAFESHAMGRGGSFRIVPSADGYQWEIPAGPTTIRYTAHFANGTWTEIGERLTGTAPPIKFFEMNLRRVGDSDWPEAGAMKPE